ncbi:MAG: M20/M25/M40 family metallo-hydrolase [Acidobacteriota bacterium]|nr:M20/M25/M40 family metallo-hydrolase [Acidobacteriota bacterium]
MIKVETRAAVPERYRAGFETLTGPASRALLSFLASDFLEGREAGSRGYRLAAEYAASLFALWRIEPAGDSGGDGARSYLQEVVMKEYTGLGCTLSWQGSQESAGGGRVFHEGVDLENYYRNRIPETLTAPVVFAGYGIREDSIGYDDFAKLDVKGRIVMILDGVPGRDDPASPFMKADLAEKYKGFRSFIGPLNKAAEVAKLGPVAVLVVRDDMKDGDIYDQMGPAAESDERPLITEPSRLCTLPGAKREGGAIFITREAADVLLSSSGRNIEGLRARIKSDWKPASLEIAGGKLTIRTTAECERLLRCHNVVGFIPGSDPKLKDETVTIGAHLDHLGRRDRYVFNGADDNGSGAAGVLAIARAIAGLPVKPKRTIVFCLWTGEELGMLGSSAYIRKPAFPLSRAAAYLNLDMIGRTYDEESLKARMRRLKVPAEAQKNISADNFAVVAFAAGRGLGEILRQADQTIGIDLWPQAEAVVKSSGIVSDYLPFAAAGVPYLYWAGVMHADYHQTGDEAAKINPEWMARIIRLVYLTAAALADR